MPAHFPVATAQQLTEYVRSLRRARGLTQADVAALLGVSSVRVATIEKDVGRLSSKSLIGLLQLLGARLELNTDLPIAPNNHVPPASTNRVSEGADTTSTTYRTSRGGEW